VRVYQQQLVIEFVEHEQSCVRIGGR